MSIITRQLHLRGDRGRTFAEGLFETGATYSFIRRDLAERLATPLPLDEPMRFETAQDSNHLTAVDRIVLTFLLNGYRFSAVTRLRLI